MREYPELPTRRRKDDATGEIVIEADVKDAMGNATTDGKGAFCRLSFTGLAMTPARMTELNRVSAELNVAKETMIRAAIYAWLDAREKRMQEMA